jgi:hypothetical protein
MCDCNKNCKCDKLVEIKANKLGNKEFIVDLTQTEAAYISTKKRGELKESNFLDPKRRSFPIRPGKECVDLNAALHRIGTYKGSMSHEELHSKIMSRMKEHGCSLPKSDKK